MYKIDRNVPISGGDRQEGTDIWALKNNYISVTPLQVTLGKMHGFPDQTASVESLFGGFSDLLETSLGFM